MARVTGRSLIRYALIVDDGPQRVSVGDRGGLAHSCQCSDYDCYHYVLQRLRHQGVLSHGLAGMFRNHEACLSFTARLITQLAARSFSSRTYLVGADPRDGTAQRLPWSNVGESTVGAKPDCVHRLSQVAT